MKKNRIPLWASFRRLLNRTKRILNARWSFGQFIPLQTLNRSVFEYDITFYAAPEIYCPPWAPYKDAPYLSLNLVPTAIGPAYYFRVAEAAVTKSLVVDTASPRRVFVELLSHPSPAAEGQPWAYDLAKRKRAIRQAGASGRELHNAYILSSTGWDNYYHFVIDSCLRYSELETSGVISPDVNLLVFDKPRGWQEAYLKLLDVDADRLIVLPDAGKVPFLVSSLLVASPLRSRRVVSSGAAARFRDRMTGHLPDKSRIKGRRLYVSRNDSSKRRLLNEPEVIELLQPQGFEVVTLGRMSVIEQIELFSSATAIVAPHGAGLTNIIYSQRPTLIEILPADRWNLGGFIALTNSIGGQHFPVVSAPHEPGRYLRSGADDVDYVVDLDKLKKAMSVALG